MSEIRLFRVDKNKVQSIAGSSVAVEKSLQDLIESNLETLLGIRLLATEYSTTKSHSGRIDTLGIDESNRPVILEYKRALNENVINQGLFYLDWLLDHQADFKLLVIQKFGNETSEKIEWSSPRLICIAGDFTKYDQYAIGQMPRNIDLIRYRRYGDDLLLLEQIAAHSVEKQSQKPVLSVPPVGEAIKTPKSSKPVAVLKLDQCSLEVLDWYEQLKTFAFGLGENIQEYATDSYIAFRAIKNFTYITFRPTLNKIVLELILDDSIAQENVGFVLPAKGQNKWRKVEIKSHEDVVRSQHLLLLSYQRT